MFVINLAIEIFCDGKDGYPCKGAHSYPFIAKRNLSQIENFKFTVKEASERRIISINLEILQNKPENKTTS